MSGYEVSLTFPSRTTTQYFLNKAEAAVFVTVCLARAKDLRSITITKRDLLEDSSVTSAIAESSEPGLPQSSSEPPPTSRTRPRGERWVEMW